MVWLYAHGKGMNIAGTVMLQAMWAYVLLLHMLALLPVHLPHSLHEPGWSAGCAAQQQQLFGLFTCCTLKKLRV